MQPPDLETKIYDEKSAQMRVMRAVLRPLFNCGGGLNELSSTAFWSVHLLGSILLLWVITSSFSYVLPYAFLQFFK